MKKIALYTFITVAILGTAFSPFLGNTKVFAQEPENPVTLEDINAINDRIGDRIANPEAYLGEGLPGGTVDNSTGESGPGTDAGKGVKPADGPEPIGCFSIGLPTGINFNLEACLANGAYFVMWIVSWILFLAGLILDASLYYTIHLSELMQKVPVVDIGWKIFRDLANIFFIFLLIWIAISTILGFQSGKTKELLVHLIIIALLMNFSLFITKTVIDGSNIVAIHFYNLIVPQSEFTAGSLSTYAPPGSFSGAFMEGLKIQTLYEAPKGIGDTLAGRVSGAVVGGLVAGPGGALIGLFSTGGNVLNMAKIILMGVFGSALMLVVAYVFFVAAILFIIRIVVLMFVMILSPLAFLAYIIPATEKYTEQWREALIKQSLFAPIYLALAFVVVKTIQSEAFQNMMTVTSGGGMLERFGSAGSGGFMPAIGIIINFILLIGLMLGCILIAKKMEAYGHEAATELGHQAGGFVGRTIARGTYITFAGSAVGRVAPLFGAKAKDFGEKFKLGAEKFQKKVDIAELDKKFGKTAFGRTEIGDFIREKTTGGALFGTKAKFGGEKSVKESYEESEKLRQQREEIVKRDIALKDYDTFDRVEQNYKAYKKPTVADFTNEAGEFDQAGFATATQRYIETFEPDRTNYAAGTAGDTKFATANKLYQKNKNVKPKRSMFPAGTAGDQLFAQSLTRHAEEYFEKPNATVITDSAELVMANQMASDRKEHQEKWKKSYEKAEADLATAVNFISPQGLADMGEHDIGRLAKYANLSQIDAVMKSPEWTLEEKRKILTPKFKSYVDEFKELDKKVEIYEAEQKELEKLVIAGDIRIDGRDGSVIEDTNQKIVDGNIVVSGIIKCKKPVAPPMPPHLKGWARNDMTIHGYEVLYALMPDALKSKSLVGATRHGFTHKELRFNNNLGFNDRNELSFIKDAKIRRFVDRKHPDYVVANTEAERQTAFNEAKTAAQALLATIPGATNEQKREAWEKEWEKARAKYLQKDLIIEKGMKEWASGRSSDEIASARSLFRNSSELHTLIDKGIVSKWEGKDSEDIVFLLRDLVRSYKAEIDGKGIMTLENRKALEDILYNPRSRIQIPTLTESELREVDKDIGGVKGKTDVSELETILKQLRQKPQVSTSHLSSVVDQL